MVSVSDRRLAALLAVLGLLALTNHWWLFPHEGDRRYTYEREPIAVENGTLTYDYRTGEFHRENDLVEVGCEVLGDDTGSRACAFDAYLAEHGPVRTTAHGVRETRPRFVRLDDGYYHRITERNGSKRTYDVEPVALRDLLAAVAFDVSGITRDDVRGENFGVGLRVAVTGDPRTTFEDLDDDDLGAVYLDDGAYYTVVRSGETRVDRPLLSRDSRGIVTVIGVFVLLAAGLMALDDPDSRSVRRR